jgi:hypothetical protein
MKHFTSGLNQLSPGAGFYRLRRVLRLDPDRFESPADSEANRLLTRGYRKPFSVPGSV